MRFIPDHDLHIHSHLSPCSGSPEQTAQRIFKYAEDMNFSKEEQEISHSILKEIKARLNFLKNVGLDYLTLSRLSGTLSGGESQRIRLATQIGSKLTGVLYVLDEPSIGLHQRDNEKLIASMKEMRDLGNTLIVVEHDIDTMMAADYLVDIGPGAGVLGGHIMAAGTPEEMKNPNSLTGKYLTGEEKIEVPKKRRKGNGLFLEVKGAQEHNLKKVNVKFPLGKFVCVTGVSGSGKSTLVNDILYNALTKHVYKSKVVVGKCDNFIYEMLEKILRDLNCTIINARRESNNETFALMSQKVTSNNADLGIVISDDAADLKAALETNDVVYESYLHDTEITLSCWSSNTMANCAVATKDGVTYIVAHQQNVGVSVFKLN